MQVPPALHRLDLLVLPGRRVALRQDLVQAAAGRELLHGAGRSRRRGQGVGLGASGGGCPGPHGVRVLLAEACTPSPSVPGLERGAEPWGGGWEGRGRRVESCGRWRPPGAPGAWPAGSWGLGRRGRRGRAAEPTSAAGGRAARGEDAFPVPAGAASPFPRQGGSVNLPLPWQLRPPGSCWQSLFPQGWGTGGRGGMGPEGCTVGARSG